MKGKFLGGIRSNVRIHEIFHSFDERSRNIYLVFSQDKLVTAPLDFIPILLFVLHVVLEYLIKSDLNPCGFWFWYRMLTL